MYIHSINYIEIYNISSRRTGVTGIFSVVIRLRLRKRILNTVISCKKCWTNEFSTNLHIICTDETHRQFSGFYERVDSLRLDAYQSPIYYSQPTGSGCRSSDNLICLCDDYFEFIVYYNVYVPIYPYRISSINPGKPLG